MPPRGSAASSRVLHCSFFTGASGYAFGYASGCASVYRHLVAVDFTADASYTMTLGTAGADWPGLMISIIMIFSIMIFVIMLRWLTPPTATAAAANHCSGGRNLTTGR